LLNVADVPESNSPLVVEHVKGQADGEQGMDVPTSVKVAPDPQASLARVSSGHDTEAGGFVLMSRDSEDVGRGELCSLLMRQL
jgi:hypothetical protein